MIGNELFQILLRNKFTGPFADLNTQGESLYIKNIKRYQSGHYVCLANNNVPPATTREMLVKVQCK